MWAELLLLACGELVISDDKVITHDSPPLESTPPDDSPDDSPTDDSGEDPCAALCDDGLDCTGDRCDADGRCVHDARGVCDWPASLPPDVVALAGLDPDFDRSLSGATWNAGTRELWVLRGDGSTIWRLREDGAGGWQLDDRAPLDRVDVESLTLSDPAGAPRLVHVMVEIQEQITAFDLSVPGTAVEVRTWDTSPWLDRDGTRGSEGLAFVPDAALAAWGFVDGDGLPRTSTLGHGGLFFVGTQNGGALHVFDLSDTDETFTHVGVYPTSREDTSGLEFDASTGRLYIWHGGNDNDLEIVRLSSTEQGGERRFDTEAIFDYPLTSNVEGIAVFGQEDCVGGVRTLVFTIDDGQDRALDLYTDWPLCGP